MSASFWPLYTSIIPSNPLLVHYKLNTRDSLIKILWISGDDEGIVLESVIGQYRHFLAVKRLPTYKIFHKFTCMIWHYKCILRYPYNYRCKASRRKPITPKYKLHLINSHFLNCYIKRTSATNCEIKMYTGLLQKLQILLQWYGWAIQFSNLKPQPIRGHNWVANLKIWS